MIRKLKLEGKKLYNEEGIYPNSEMFPPIKSIIKRFKDLVIKITEDEEFEYMDRNISNMSGNSFMEDGQIELISVSPISKEDVDELIDMVNMKLRRYGEIKFKVKEYNYIAKDNAVILSMVKTGNPKLKITGITKL